MIAVVIGVVGIIFWTNKPKGTSKGFQVALAQSTKASQLKKQTDEVVKSVDDLISGSTLTSDQLDIWTLPDTGRTESGFLNDTKNGILTNKTTGETLTRQEELSGSKEQEEAITEVFGGEKELTDTDVVDPFETGEFDITLADGSTRRITINESIPRNEWELEHFEYQKPEMKYYENGEQISSFGVDLSATAGEVDFSRLKRVGCDYAMVRVGQRGYASGNIIMDKKLEDNIEKAIKAGMGVGLYFDSQAITKNEILEEVDCVLSVAEDYKITYPIMFDMESVEGDLARIDGLDNDTRTQLAYTFLKEVEEAGFQAILYGNREWLLAKLNLEELVDFDVCYAENSDRPEYPYQFTMWNYNDQITINGVENATRLFVNLKSYE